MVNIQDKTKCSGCHACAAVCPTSALTMAADEEGFFYPEVNAATCIDCSLCEKVCPLTKETSSDQSLPEAYAVINRDESVRLASSSGGVFTAIASCLLSRGGVVFGAAFDENFDVVHKCVKTEDELSLLQGSKYTQSKIGDAYQKAKVFLEQGRLVLFTGTPCQIEGLLAFLKKPYDNLVTQDIICHGVPSALIFQKYLNWHQKEKGQPVREVSFRAKRNGWRGYEMSIRFGDGSEYCRIHREDPMMRLFLKNLCLRPSCYDCHFKGVNRKSDITLADFWGVEKVFPEMDDDKGVSLVIVHTQKGKNLLMDVKDSLAMQNCDVDQAVSFNSAATSSVAKPKERDAFMSAISKADVDFESASQPFLRLTFKQKIRSFLSRVKRKLFRR